MKLWIKIIAAVLAVAVLAFAGYALLRSLTNVLTGAQLSSEPDPMFAEETVLPTRPPELDAEEAPPKRPTLDDYVPEVETPVEKTAAELIAEAMEEDG